MTLTARLDYTFQNPELLKLALTHRSAHKMHNERLEFLGDRVLNLCVAAMLYQNKPQAEEGELARYHAALVREETLAIVAEQWALADDLQLGRFEAAGGGASNQSILADAVEAVLAAVYLDGGLSPAQQIVQTYWQPLVDTVRTLDAKTDLQERLQAAREALPHYEVIGSTGKDHDKMFTVKVSCAWGCATGQGSSKQAASQAAAQSMLEKTI